MTNIIDIELAKLGLCISQDKAENVESDGIEIKPVPSSSGDWKEIYKTTCAFRKRLLEPNGDFWISSGRTNGIFPEPEKVKTSRLFERFFHFNEDAC